MPLSVGDRLGPYEILALVGKGGMGEVYRARDARLGRDVALKVLPEIFSKDPERMARFEREAQLLASLNHPNIAILHGLEESNGIRALVMELVEGSTLAERIQDGPIPLDEALPIARQIADALEYAHEKGIIHRDLKPANIKVNAEGRAKLLDFGLAKALDAGSASTDPSNSPTISVAATRAGVILGTAGYMSPEQARGKPADRRADIWAFGVVLYETLTGKPLFAGESAAETLAAVLTKDLTLDGLPSDTPAAIHNLLRRCLDKDPKNRLRDIGEARIAIEGALAGETPLLENAPDPSGARRLWLAWSVAAVATVGLASVTFLHFREKPPAPAAQVRFQIPAPENGPSPELSPDGRKLAFTAGDRLWVHFLESGESRDLTATTTGGRPLMAQPFDNRRLELKGRVAPVAEQVGNYGGGSAPFSASANDVLAFQRNSTSDQQLTWYDREGKVMGTAGELGGSGYLALSPDGTRLAMTRTSGADAANIWLLDLSRGGASTRFTFGSASNTVPVWSPDGSRLIFSSNRDGPFNLYQKPADGVKNEEILLKSSEDKFATSWSRDGRFLLYTVVEPKTKNDLWVLPLEGDRKPVPFLITEFGERQARFSPDGHWVAYTSDESGQDEIYVRSFSMNSTGAVEASGKWPISNGFGVDPHWRGDGRELYYRSRGGVLLAVEIATNPAFRAGNPEPLGVSTFAFGSVNTEFGSLWDSAADGRRFLRRATKSGPQPYTVVLNWQAGLKK